MKSNIKFLIVGIIFGIVFVKAEIVSWFRMQEMFRFQGFHMYGVIGSAVLVAMIGVLTIRKFSIKTLDGESIVLEGKKFINHLDKKIPIRWWIIGQSVREKTQAPPGLGSAPIHPATIQGASSDRR